MALVDDLKKENLALRLQVAELAALLEKLAVMCDELPDEVIWMFDDDAVIDEALELVSEIGRDAPNLLVEALESIVTLTDPNLSSLFEVIHSIAKRALEET